MKVEGVPFIADGLRLAENEMFFHVADIHGGRYDFDSTHHSPTRGSGFGGRKLTRLKIILLPTRGSGFGGRKSGFGGRNLHVAYILAGKASSSATIAHRSLVHLAPIISLLISNLVVHLSTLSLFPHLLNPF